jgi:hypothetical protein
MKEHICPLCNRKITWFNDFPLKGFCWGTEENEHKEYSVIVKRDTNPNEKH